MSKLFQQLLKATPVALGASLLAVSPSFAQEATTNTNDILQEINNYSQNSNSQNGAMSQVNSVSQLRDVSPGDWAFEALRNLVERYGCIAGYPDRTFRGNKPLTRYEFAAGLNSCLQQIERLIGTGSTSGPRGMNEEEMTQVQRLTQEFQAELASLGARVDNLEARVGVVEKQQFSTTTKLSGEAILSAGGVFGDKQPKGGDIQDNITFNDRIRLNFNTSFTGKDLLRTRLQAGNFDTSYGTAAGTDMARLGYEASGGNNVTIDEIYYRFPIGDKGRVWVGAQGLDIDDVFNTHNPNFESSGGGALTRFNRYNPAVYRSNGAEGAGVAGQYKFTNNIALSALYLTSANSASDPANEKGLFDGAYTAGAQVDVNVGKNLDFGLAYLHTYQPGGSVNLSGSTGSNEARLPFTNAIGTSAHHIGLSGQWKPTSKISLGAFGGYVNATAEEGAMTTLGQVKEGDKADIWTWGANLAFLDFGGEGNVLGIAGGMAPKLTSTDVLNGNAKNNGNGYIIEAQYRWQVNDNIQITPGAYVVIEPNHVDGASEIWGGVVRTTFKF
jgi:Carbohydrate-selective porin, OprB family/S-layer homology domain